MENKESFAKEISKDLKKKAIRKYALMALAAVIDVSTVVGLNIEDKDSKLPDGQGNIVTSEQSADKNEVGTNNDTASDKDTDASYP